MTNQKLSTLKTNDANDAWWNFGTSTWLLIAGLFVFNIGVFVQPGLLDGLGKILFRTVDFRLWAWYYFIFLGIIVAFSIRWFAIFSNDEDAFFSSQSPEEIRAFMIFSIVTTSLIIIFVLIRQTFLYKMMAMSLYTLLVFGGYSYLAFFTFSLILCVIGAISATAWNWVTKWQMD